MFEAIDEATIRYGLGAVKGVGRGACEAIAEERGRDGTFEDLLDFCRRIESSKLNRRTLEALVNAGALDALGSNRATLMLQLPEVLKARSEEHTSELQSLMRISYAVFCLKKKNTTRKLN